MRAILRAYRAWRLRRWALDNAAWHDMSECTCADVFEDEPWDDSQEWTYVRDGEL